MKYLAIISFCILTILFSFIFVKLIPKKTEGAIFSTISMFIGVVFTFVFIYLIIQFGKSVNAYEETWACVIVTAILLELIATFCD